ncbi:uncharacterized protein LOC132194284 [Neocloeon triangulifer]|uniref:uncharacterized protein LOC132194284 n=1 Tax=Neocloeon triangulifer TaxID=2078957 RepID=UPI00286EBE26|nr:uncharacterized protein LOC132194284 [Neocloeon triangulifer]
MHTAAALLFLMMGMIAPFSCKIGVLPSSIPKDDFYDLPDNVYIGPGGEITVRPDRPKHFITADELKLYLDQLRTYYAMAGRPRFGKRDPVVAVQHHTVTAGKSREMHHLALPEDDYGDPAGEPFRRDPANNDDA